MSLGDAIRRMKEAGATPEVIVIAVEEISAAMAELDARRANDRARKARQLGKANDVPSEPASREPSREPSRENHVNSPQEKEKTQPPTRIPLGANAPIPKGIDGRKSVQARARAGGSRLPDEWAPSEALVAFAGDLGFTGQALDEQVAEFGDYWRALPGFRARKLDWDMTFKNRLRDVASRKKGNAHGNGKRSLGDASRDLIRRVDEAFERQREVRPAPGDPPGGPTVRLLPRIGEQRS